MNNCVWGIQDNSKCTYCDILEHHLYDCITNKTVLDKLQIWTYNKLNINFSLIVCEVPFRLPYRVNDTINL